MSNPMPSPDAPTMTRDVHAGLVLADDDDIVWQGAPTTIGVAHQILRGDLILAYAALLLLIGVFRAAVGQVAWPAALWPLFPAVIAGGIVLVLARTIARSTRYIVTSRRIVIRYGAALPRSLSIPFSRITSLSVAVGRRGRGDIALRVRDDLGVSYAKLWPHVRAWRLERPEPTLRNVADAAVLATRLSRLLSEAEQNRQVALAGAVATQQGRAPLSSAA